MVTRSGKRDVSETDAYTKEDSDSDDLRRIVI